ncbi:MAG: hypothetical protein COB01_03805 [Lutibacter sp.]|nr:MAG: hypothetical protein COB01_03805 [Lutibacter sp.]
MDELELLKKDWKKSESSYPKLSYNEIYKLIHKKSSSIVKWIFVIGIGEFLFWAVLNLLIPESYLEIYEKLHLKSFLYVTQAIHYLIIAVFIYLFYKNYKAISVTDSTNLLMQKILKTRKTVNYYVYYNIGLYIILSIVINLIMFSQPDILIDVLGSKNKNSIDNSQFLIVMLVAQVITLFVVCGLLWLYYRIVYGILLKRLYKNYNELEKMDN